MSPCSDSPRSNFIARDNASSTVSRLGSSLGESEPPQPTTMKSNASNGVRFIEKLRSNRQKAPAR
jgi:hypothetical protein